MSLKDQSQDYALSVMTLDIVKDVLRQPDNLQEVVTKLMGRFRELSGANTVIMAQYLLDGDGHYTHVLLGVQPERRQGLAESNDTKRIFEIIHGIPEMTLWRPGAQGGEAESIIDRMEYGLTLAIPLDVGTEREGALLILGLVDDEHIAPIMKMLPLLESIFLHMSK